MVSLVGVLQGRRGPQELVLVRHAESMGNLADAEARDADADRLELSARDADVELSPNGEEQGRTLGRWVAGLDDATKPDLVVSSPYRRAADTARAAVDELGIEVLLDERLQLRKGHPGRLPGGGEAALARRQVLLPAAVGGELGGRRAAGAEPAGRPA